MLISTRPLTLPTTSMSHVEINSDRSYHTNTSSMVSSMSVPKNFNVPFAIQHGYFRCVRYLLELDYDPNERDSQLHTPLILCAYVENDRWSLSIAQNLLEKGAKIALADNARRNAMHHACALQRVHLVQLYLSCLEFNIEAKDCDGNTFLHYAAITGNCEIAELLINTEEKMGISIDQYVNREGCSAVDLALRYGHIECANQIAHRDPDEFFVVPRPLSLYESPPKTDSNQFQTTAAAAGSRKRSATPSQTTSTNKANLRPSALSFGLLKIIFNESDVKYTTHLAKLCDEGKQTYPHQQRVRQKKSKATAAMTKVNQTYHSSIETIVNGSQPPKTADEQKTCSNSKEIINPADRLPPRVPSAFQQHMPIKNVLLHHDGNKLKTNIRRQTSDSAVNHHQLTVTPLFESPRNKNKSERPTTATGIRRKISDPTGGLPSHPNPRKIRPFSSYKKIKRKSSATNRPQSASVVSTQQYSNLTFESSTYSKTLFAGRPLSAVLQNHQRRSPVLQIVDPSCSIREAKGAASRYNNPEELFGIKPEELFGTTDNQPKINNPRLTNNNIYLKSNNLSQQQQQQYMYQQDVDKLVDLYALQHTYSYRPTVTRPVKLPGHPSGLKTGEKRRKSSSSKGSMNSVKTTNNMKLSTLAALNISKRYPETRCSTLKVVHT